MKTVKRRFGNFDRFERAWHRWASMKLAGNELYYNGQFDEIPFILWKMNVKHWKTL